MGAGLADPDGVLVEPFVFVADDVPTDSREGLEGVVDVVTRRVGIRVCVPSSNQIKSFVTQSLANIVMKYEAYHCYLAINWIHVSSHWRSKV